MKLPKARIDNIVVQTLDKELLIYDLSIDKAYCLNETSAIIYNACNGIGSTEELKNRTQFTDDLINLALDGLQKDNLIESLPINHLDGLSRREAIKKAGLATMFALPVISALVAPQAANAQSIRNLALGATCTSSSQCSSSGAPNCLNRSPSTGSRRCCIGADSRFDTGGVVNSCSGGTCSDATFACQSDAGTFCCSGSATKECTGSSCACRCD